MNELSYINDVCNSMLNAVKIGDVSVKVTYNHILNKPFFKATVLTTEPVQWIEVIEYSGFLAINLRNKSFDLPLFRHAESEGLEKLGNELKDAIYLHYYAD